MFANKQKIVFQRGTLKLTQIDTLEMSMWEIALIPLTERLDDCFLVRMWYVDLVRLLALLLTSKKIWTFESIKKTVLLSDMLLCHVITKEHFLKQHTLFLLMTQWKQVGILEIKVGQHVLILKRNCERDH